MTNIKVPEAVTGGVSNEEESVGTAVSDMGNQEVAIGKQYGLGFAEIESPGLTLAGTTRRIPSSSSQANECDTLKANYRAATASAFFDPEAMAMLEFLAEKRSFEFAELAERIKDPVMWIKLAILIRAYLVEPLDNGVRITQGGLQAIKDVDKYLSRLNVGKRV